MVHTPSLRVGNSGPDSNMIVLPITVYLANLLGAASARVPRGA